MFPVKQAKRSPLGDVSCKTSEALFAKQKCFFKFTKKQIYKNSVFRFLYFVFWYRRHSEGSECDPKNPLKFEGVESLKFAFL